MEIAPAISSAIPPKMSRFRSARDERPAVKAKGTVSPSDWPTMLYGSGLAHAGKALGVGGRRNAHIPDNIWINELALAPHNQFTTTYAVPFVAVG